MESCWVFLSLNTLNTAGMDMSNAPTVQSRQPLTYRLMESVGLGGPRWLGSSWQRGIAESGSSQLSTLMIETPGDLVWDLPCVQQASCLEGGPLLWIWPLYLHVNQKSDDDDDDDEYLDTLRLIYIFTENGTLGVQTWQIPYLSGCKTWTFSLLNDLKWVISCTCINSTKGSVSSSKTTTKSNLSCKTGLDFCGCFGRWEYLIWQNNYM